MSAAMSGSDSAIREGFLCPICFKDLNSVYQLQTHFEENHSHEDKAVLQQLKGFFGKAKKLLSKQEEQSGEVVDDIIDVTDERPVGPITTSACVGGFDVSSWPPQELGAVCEHYDYFRGQRGTRIDRSTVETNKLLIRLEKLVKFNVECSEPSKRKGKRARKAFEKTVVPWKDDSSTKFCPFCLERFGLSLRRHHCRLCGNIACLKCSDFVPDTVCESVLKSEEELLKEHRQKQARKSDGVEAGGAQAMSGTLRICKNCDGLLVIKLQKLKQKAIKPASLLLYERLTEVKNHLLAQLSVHNPRVEFLMSGSSSHSRNFLEGERTKILKNFDLIDTISKRILALSASTSSPSHQRLYHKIRTHCTLFIQANMQTMVALPTSEELQRLEGERRVAIARRIQEEKAAELEAQRQERIQHEKQEQRTLERMKKGHTRIPSWPLNLNKSKQETSPTKRSEAGAKTLEGGWKPSVVSEAELMASSDNPMIQQMNIIKNYIKQAKEMQRTDEVKMLQDNLRELEMEYGRQARF
ncbi:rabenosyn-5-like isoform X1 [Asterias rubens]|uniref:rabenosyn-5-like isoform X1 n=1 Tax=Asterias rubens TaxID=7604 RepID=UPI0014558009|nr:rabenosyn-5-like isoform X1 [Asterias rubens]XP_033647987.1 rabenosyn-5-like isoform X1 [Asterias rubens]